jgi:hypothetical protein
MDTKDSAGSGDDKNGRIQHNQILQGMQAQVCGRQRRIWQELLRQMPEASQEFKFWLCS